MTNKELIIEAVAACPNDIEGSDQWIAGYIEGAKWTEYKEREYQVKESYRCNMEWLVVAGFIGMLAHALRSAGQ